MVKKMTGWRAISANALATEVGVSQATLSKWKREASRVLDVSMKEPEQVEPTAKKRAQDWMPEEKLEATRDTDGMAEGSLGASPGERGYIRTRFEASRKEAVDGQYRHWEGNEQGEAHAGATTTAPD